MARSIQYWTAHTVSWRPSFENWRRFSPTTTCTLEVTKLASRVGGSILVIIYFFVLWFIRNFACKIVLLFFLLQSKISRVKNCLQLLMYQLIWIVLCKKLLHMCAVVIFSVSHFVALSLAWWLMKLDKTNVSVCHHPAWLYDVHHWLQLSMMPQLNTTN